jgi:hypothetical protein
MSCSLRCRPWRDDSCEVILVERVPTATSRMSRSRCSTPISSASSASIVLGVWTKVFDVVVPSCNVLVPIQAALAASRQLSIMRKLTSLISSTAK